MRAHGCMHTMALYGWLVCVCVCVCPFVFVRTCACWSLRRTTQVQMNRTHQCSVASVRERCDHQTHTVTQVLVSVLDL